MYSVQVHSEIGRLRHVLVHCPGAEIDHMVPELMNELLFDDILHGPGFDCGVLLNFGLLHVNDVGPNPRDCRSEAGAFGGGSLQVVRSNQRSNIALYADMDMFAPYDIYGFGLAGHAVFEVAARWPGKGWLKSHFLNR